MRRLFFIICTSVALHGTTLAADAPQADVPIEQLQRDASAGDAKAMGTLGFKYLTGKGVKQDPAEAMKLFNKAAAAGDARGMYAVSLLYRNGQGVAQDDKTALQWCEKAAEAGNTDAMFDAALMRLQGVGAERDV